MDSSKLSADAPVFVPTQHLPGSPVTLPSYVFNCYPFVTDGSFHTSHAVTVPGASRHGKPSHPGPVMASASATVLNLQGTPPRNSLIRGPPPLAYTIRGPSPRYGHPFLHHNNVPTHAPPLHTRHQNAPSFHGPIGHPLPPFSVPPVAQLGGGFVPHAVVGDRADFVRLVTSVRPSSYSLHKQREASSFRGKVSTGTQNILSTHGITRHPRTLIYMDSACQTDFCDEIAGSTLAEVPSDLFLEGSINKARHKGPATRSLLAPRISTDSEEIDSDSGYSSPMHRKNQISSGTDANISQYRCTAQEGLTPCLHMPAYNRPSQNATALYHAAVRHSAGVVSEPAALSSVHISYATAVASSRNLHATQRIIAGKSAECHDVNSAEDVVPISDGEGKIKKKSRRRGRRRKKGGSDLEGSTSDAGAWINDSCHPLSSSSPSQQGYISPILSQEEPLNILAPSTLSENFPSLVEAGFFDDSSECKLSGKRKKRREQANEMALREQLEIELEQQALKVVKQSNKPPIAKATGKKSSQLINVSIVDLIKTNNSKPGPQLEATKPVSKNTGTGPSLNPLDSTAPSVKRGKEREVPKAKKPSPLKKVILKEREEKKRLRYIGDGPVDIISTPDSSLFFTSEPEENNPEGQDQNNVDDLEDDDVISELSDLAGAMYGESDNCTPVSQDLSPVSQNSPISVGLLSPGDSLHGGSGMCSPLAESNLRNDVVHKIHSRRFREYCNQVLDKEIDQCCTSLLQTLVKFQDRLYHKDPVKAKSKRRLVLGLREVTKHLKVKRINLVIISTNLEKIQSKGGLDEALNVIINMCTEQNKPFVFALGRRTLGRACAKLVPVSVVGVFNYHGAEELYQKLIELTKQAREAYHEMVAAMAKEIAEYPGISAGSSGMLYSHMGHSRTPSGCSAISITSSILSEASVERLEHKAPNSVAAEEVESVAPTVFSPASAAPSSTTSAEFDPLQDDIYDIDEGNEADTEDNELNNHMALKSESRSEVQGSIIGREEHFHERGCWLASVNGDCDIASDRLTEQPDLTAHKPSTGKWRRSHGETHGTTGSHSDSRSQTSLRTFELNADSASNHSSWTLEGTCEPDHVSDSLQTCTNNVRLLNINRVESWVRDIDTKCHSLTPDLSQDDDEFTATYTACEANSEVLISRSRSPSIAKQDESLR